MPPQNLTVDALVPPSLHLALPSLRSLKQRRCTLSPAAATAQLDSESSGIQRLTVCIWGQAAARLAQLRQLPSLRDLTSLTLDTVDSTAFLPSLSSQLTALQLDNYFRECKHRTQRPAGAWAATLLRLALCTRLQSLALPAATAEELRPVAKALPQLRRLHLTYDFNPERSNVDEVEQDGDAMVEVLLGLTQLTSLRWEETWPYAMDRSYADRPCSWRELTFAGVGVKQLSRLPLHSLTAPVTFESLDIDYEVTLADAQRLVSALVGEGRPGVRWQGSQRLVQFNTWCFDGAGMFEHGATPADTPAALLRALQPLLAGAADVCVWNIKWDAEAVRALPPSCRALTVVEGEVPLAAAVEMAQHLRQLEGLDFVQVAMEAWCVVRYAVVEEDERRLARQAVAAHGGGGAPGEGQGRRVRVRVEDPRDPDDAYLEEGRAWEQARSLVQSLGLPWLDLVVEG